VYNDWENASLLVKNFVGRETDNVRLVIIDNGSNHSDEILLGQINQISGISVMRLDTNHGFGGAIFEASKACNTDWLVWIPGNMKVLPSEMLNFLAVLESCHPQTFVKAQRINRPLIDQSKTLIASVVQTIFAGQFMPDTGGTPSAIHRTSPLWKAMESAPKDYKFDSYMLFTANRLKLKVQRPKVPYHQRLIGKSHWQTGFAAEVSLMASLVRSIINWRLSPPPDAEAK
jgi:hypothetical protein